MDTGENITLLVEVIRMVPFQVIGRICCVFHLCWPKPMACFADRLNLPLDNFYLNRFHTVDVVYLLFDNNFLVFVESCELTSRAAATLVPIIFCPFPENIHLYTNFLNW